MKKRLRKKKRIGEFREYGIHLLLYIPDDNDDADLMWRFITEIVEPNGWQCGGGSCFQKQKCDDGSSWHGCVSDVYDFVIERWPKQGVAYKSMTSDDVIKIDGLMTEADYVSNHKILGLFDVWHDDTDYVPAEMVEELKSGR